MFRYEYKVVYTQNVQMFLPNTNLVWFSLVLWYREQSTEITKLHTPPSKLVTFRRVKARNHT